MTTTLQATDSPATEPETQDPVELLKAAMRFGHPLKNNDAYKRLLALLKSGKLWSAAPGGSREPSASELAGVCLDNIVESLVDGQDGTANELRAHVQDALKSAHRARAILRGG